MFVTRSFHNSELRRLVELGESKAKQHQEEVKRLEAHISDLRKLVFSPPTQEPTQVAREVDAIITPVNDAPIFSPIAEDSLREQNLIFSGEYDNVGSN